MHLVADLIGLIWPSLSLRCVGLQQHLAQLESVGIGQHTVHRLISTPQLKSAISMHTQEGVLAWTICSVCHFDHSLQ